MKRLSKEDRKTLQIWIQNTLSQKEREVLIKLGYNGAIEMIKALVKFKNE